MRTRAFDLIAESRFAPNVDATGGDSACWPWKGAVDPHGYGTLSVRGLRVFAHRYSAKRAGVDVDGLCVCHKCDNPLCVNPSHLFAGTHKDNGADCSSKGRSFSPSGEDNGKSRLTVKQVMEMRRLWSTGCYSQRRIGDAFGLKSSHINHILRRKLWAHV